MTGRRYDVAEAAEQAYVLTVKLLQPWNAVSVGG